MSVPSSSSSSSSSSEHRDGGSSDNPPPTTASYSSTSPPPSSAALVDEQPEVTSPRTAAAAGEDAAGTTYNDRIPRSSSISSSSSGPQCRSMHVLFLSSDTGGGHRASAESLAKQFQLLFPGTTYDMLDVVEKDGVPPYNSLVSYYKHLSAHPTQWKLVYSFSNSRAFEMLADAHLKLMCERAVRRRIMSYHPDVVVSVHPLMTNVPVLSCHKISQETGLHLPIFTVVTDLGSAHCLWFANGVEKMFVGSDKVKELAMQRGKVPPEKLVLSGLPIRHDFAVQADRLGDRNSPGGKRYQREVRADLQLPVTDRSTVLVMGGGEGVGSLSNIVDALYVEFVSQGIDALILVVCGRNEKLKTSIETRDWNDVFRRWKNLKDNNLSISSGIMNFRDACIGGGGGGGLMNVPSVSSIGAAISGAASAAVAGAAGGGQDPMSQFQSVGCLGGGSERTVTGSIRRMLSRGSLNAVESAVYTPVPPSDAPYADAAAPIHNENSMLDTNVSTSLVDKEEEKKNSSKEDTCDYSIVPPTTEKDDEEDVGILNAASGILGGCGNLDSVLPDGDDISTGSNQNEKSITNRASIHRKSNNNNANAAEGVDEANEVVELLRSETLEGKTPGTVTVVGLGFVTQMAEYMVAADILVSKAGPGTISEAAALGLPVMLTSYLPGQEEGNVDFVIDGGFGAYVADSDPVGVAEEVCMWLTDAGRLRHLSEAAKRHGCPHAARDIVRVIGDSTLKWMGINMAKAAAKARRNDDDATRDEGNARSSDPKTSHTKTTASATSS